MSVNVRTVVAVAVLSGALLVGTAATASAAGSTSLFVEPTATDIEPGQTTTVDVVVGDASGGVGAAELRLSVTDPSVASIVNVSVHGGPGFSDTNYAGSDGWVDIAYATADTTDSGAVTILTATVEGDAAGTTTVTVDPRAANDAVYGYDERGNGYDIGDIYGSTVTVGGGSDQSSSGTGDDSGPSGTDSDGGGDAGTSDSTGGGDTSGSDDSDGSGTGDSAGSDATEESDSSDGSEPSDGDSQGAATETRTEHVTERTPAATPDRAGRDGTGTAAPATAARTGAADDPRTATGTPSATDDVVVTAGTEWPRFGVAVVAGLAVLVAVGVFLRRR